MSGKKILERRCGAGLEQFANSVVPWLQTHIKSAAGTCKSRGGKRTKLWTSFNYIRSDSKGFIRSSWEKLLHDYEVDERNNLLFFQMFLRKLIIVFMNIFIHPKPLHYRKQCTEVTLTGDELNALRYACGYVGRSLLLKFEQKKTKDDKIFQFITCLGEMVVAGVGENVLVYTEYWFDIVNRGGLFLLNENSFSMFIEIEKCVHYYLPKHALSSSAGKESFHQNVHDKVTNNENVQFSGLSYHKTLTILIMQKNCLQKLLHYG